MRKRIRNPQFLPLGYTSTIFIGTQPWEGRKNSTKDLGKYLFVLSILTSRAVSFVCHAREGLYKTSCEFVMYKSLIPFCNRQI